MPISHPIILAIFIPFLLLFYLLPAGNIRSILVLATSYTYYLTFPKYFTLLLLFVTFLSFASGLVVDQTRGLRSHKFVVFGILVINVLPMILCKYLSIPNQLGIQSFVYPVGLSYYTFISIGYIIDVALDVVDVEKHPFRIALSSAFFPTVAMGPLLRTSFFRQLQFTRQLDQQRFLSGISSILIGAVLKLWIADTLAESVDAVYANINACSPIEKFMGSVAEAFQIYADWQGYSLIAIGMSRLMGIDFPDNFRQPYLSTNIGEFWRSWHIALVNWFRDYIFTPIRLQFSPTSQLAIPAATFITFVLLGAWHVKGGWGYFWYGIVNALLLIYSQLTLERRSTMWKALHIPLFILNPVRILATFFIVVLTVPLARASSLTEAIEIYRDIFSNKMLLNLGELTTGVKVNMFPHMNIKISLLLIIIIVIGDIISRLTKKPFSVFAPRILQYSVYGSCIFLIILHQYLSLPVNPFVYFRY